MKKVTKVILGVAGVFVAAVVGVGVYACSGAAPLNPLGLAGLHQVREMPNGEFCQEGTSQYRHATEDDIMAFYLRHPVFGGNMNMFLGVAPELNRYMCAAEGASLPKFLEMLGAKNELMTGEKPAIDPSVDASIAIESFNYLIDQVNAGKAELIEQIYPDADVAADPDKASVRGMLYHGDPSKPLAIIAAGGGFIVEGSYNDGYPYAQKLHEQGYNVLVLTYRLGSQLHTDDQWGRGVEAAGDLAAAVAYVQDHANELGVTLDGYAVFGSSAGGLMCSALSFESIGGSAVDRGLPRPALCVCNYGLYWDVEPCAADRGLAVYALVGKTDPNGFADIADKIPALEKYLGTENVNVRILDNYPHGSSLGTGGEGEGWIDDAMAFWADVLSRQAEAEE